VAQYSINEGNNTAEYATVVQDIYQNKGIGWEMLRYLTYLATKQGLQGFSAQVLVINGAMMHLFEKMGFDIHRRTDGSVYDLRMGFCKPG
jgi:RimJ/RimL family protein N-acetyltransferase